MSGKVMVCMVCGKPREWGGIHSKAGGFRHWSCEKTYQEQAEAERVRRGQPLPGRSWSRGTAARQETVRDVVRASGAAIGGGLGGIL